MKVCILTSVHPALDTRIFHKQAKSLVTAGYDVTLVARHDKDEVVDGVRIVALPEPKSRLRRLLGTWRVFRLASKQKAAIYHFHDPELLPAGVLLKLFTRGKVIYDVHENVRWSIVTKSWLPKMVRKPLSLTYRLIERLSLPFIDEIIIAEDSYIKNYAKRRNILALRNYPVLSYVAEPSAVKKARPTIIYVGGIAEARGVLELVEATGLLKAKYENVLLTLIGPIYPSGLEEKIGGLLKQFKLQKNVRLVARVDHRQIYKKLLGCHVGIAILHPEPNYLESLPTKLFEYMAAGLPVVASRFPLWKKVIEGSNCGLTVDPLNPREVARAVEYLIGHPDKARHMGENGKKAVLEKYNWEKESQKLLALYADLLEEKVN
jgi:glycosyltransferase involved in cell wall biosynthesis